MRIGIITYHRALNYGAALQGYALTEYLRALGHEAEVIDYRCPRIESDYYQLIPSNTKRPKDYIKALLRFPKKKKRAIRFRDFELKFKFVSVAHFDTTNISESNKNYDAFISGSDQIWNHLGSSSDFHYFLDFVDEGKKKIAYSASFGYEKVPDFLTVDYKELLNRYNFISTREVSAAQIVRELIGQKPLVTCDPVLLLDSQEWQKRIDCKRIIANRYLLCYFLAANTPAYEYAVKYAESKGLKVIAINNIQKDYPGIDMMKYVSLEIFVSLFANAEAVMTDSFHGTVFSLTFNKPFNTFVASTSKVNSRVENLLGRVGLKSHIVCDFNKSDWNEIDYIAVNSEMMQYRKESKEYLTKALE